jgi:hypothetical protein
MRAFRVESINSNLGSNVFLREVRTSTPKSDSTNGQNTRFRNGRRMKARAAAGAHVLSDNIVAQMPKITKETKI